MILKSSRKTQMCNYFSLVIWEQWNYTSIILSLSGHSRHLGGGASSRSVYLFVCLSVLVVQLSKSFYTTEVQRQWYRRVVWSDFVCGLESCPNQLEFSGLQTSSTLWSFKHHRSTKKLNKIGVDSFAVLFRSVRCWPVLLCLRQGLSR